MAQNPNQATLGELREKMLAFERTLMENRGKVADLIARRQADCRDKEQLRTEDSSLRNELRQLRTAVENHRKELDDLHAQKADRDELFLHLEHQVQVTSPQGAQNADATTAVDQEAGFFTNDAYLADTGESSPTGGRAINMIGEEDTVAFSQPPGFEQGGPSRTVLPIPMSSGSLTPGLTPPPPPPPISFIAPPGPSPPSPRRRMSSIRWNKTLSRLKYSEVRSFVTLFRAYLNAANIPEEEAKILLLQSLEGEAMTLVVAVANRGTSEDILNKLMSRVKPSRSAIMKKLFETRQKTSESILDFSARFHLLTDDLPAYTDSRIRDISVENVGSQWKMTARSIIMMDANISLYGLVQKLMQLEGPDFADRMDIDCVRLRAEQEEACSYDDVGVQEASVNRIGQRGMIDFTRIRGVGDFKDCLRNLAARPNSRLRHECLDILRRQGRPFAGRGNFVPRSSRNDFGNQRRQPVRANPVEVVPEVEADNVVDDVVDEDIPFVSALGKDTEQRDSMSCQIRLEGHPTNALVDTGAEISTINVALCKKHGFLIDENKAKLVTAFNGTQSRTLGACVLAVSVGYRQFTHSFQVVGLASHKVIMGFDMLRDQGFIPEPSNGTLRLSEKNTIKCHVLRKRSDGDDVVTAMKTMEQAYLPVPSSSESAGFDLRSPIDLKIPKQSRRLVHLGMKMEIPEN